MTTLSALDAAQTIRTRIFARYTKADLNSNVLSFITVSFPSYAAIIETFRNFADLEAAKKEGLIKPRPGADADYDEAEERVKQAQAALQDYLNHMRRQLNDSHIVYKHMNKERYTLEMSATTVKKQRLGHDFTLCSSTKTVHRYLTEELKYQLIPELEAAELQLEKMEKDCTRKMYAQFVAHQSMWQRVISAISTLDCLCALATVSKQQKAISASVRPEFLEFNRETGAMLEIRDCVHPVLASTGLPGGKQFIPNDTVIGTAENKPRFILVSGPNMVKQTHSKQRPNTQGDSSSEAQQRY